MKYVNGLLNQWRVGVAALISIGIVHLLTAMALPYFYQGNGFWQRVQNLPLHRFVTLPRPRPQSQVLPFQLPDARLSICRFDIPDGALNVSAVLPEPGWSLSLYSSDGQAFYSLPASGDQRFRLNLEVLPPGDHYTAKAPVARDNTRETSSIRSPSRRGVVVILAPISGRTFTRQTETDLALATCSKQRY